MNNQTFASALGAAPAPVLASPGNDIFTAPSGYGQLSSADDPNATIIFNFNLTDATITFSGNHVIVDSATSHTVLSGFSIYQFTDGTVTESHTDPLVDYLYYYSQNPDVWAAGGDAASHYHLVGWTEGRNPNAFFDTNGYLAANPDVQAAGVDPLVQYDTAGWMAGANPSMAFDTNAYLAANPDMAATGVDPLAHFLEFGEGEGRQPIAVTQPTPTPTTTPMPTPTPTSHIASNGFDYDYYLQHNPDVAAAGIDPFVHFETVGWKEGRNPNAYFDVNGYLAHNPDVAAAGLNPLDHYHQSGWMEGRDPSVNFDTNGYLAANADVAAAGIDPVLQYLQHGQFEGRTPHGDGLWT